VVEISSKPNPSDPNVKSSTSACGFHVDIYGDTALVSYQMTNTDTGHRNPALNVTEHFGCLDTFLKRKGQWYELAAPVPPPRLRRKQNGTPHRRKR
jgi:hypothetical protein